MKTIIGLYSPVPRSGKGTLSAALSAIEPRTDIMSFADDMRAVVIPIAARFIGSEAEVKEWMTDERKEQPIPTLGVSLRHMLQALGTGWGRNLINPDIWVMIACERIRRSTASLVILDDVRQDNEYAMLYQLGAYMIRVERPDAPVPVPHSSNYALEGYHFDRDILSDKGVHGLVSIASDVLEAARQHTIDKSWVGATH